MKTGGILHYRGLRHRVLALSLAALQALPASATPAEECPVLPDPFPEITAAAANVSCDPFEGPGSSLRQPTSRNDAWQNEAAGRLTPMWAQESAGADLASEYLNSPAASGAVTVPVGTMDSGVALGHVPGANVIPPLSECIGHQDTEPCLSRVGGTFPDHGTNVADLIVGPTPVGTAPKARLSMVTTMGTGAQVLSAFNYYDQCHDSATCRPNYPRIVNLSLVFNNKQYEGYRPRLERIASRSLVVMGAGNDFPTPVGNMERMTDGIVVGSVAPNGLLSHFSQQSADGEDNVTIVAPADNHINSGPFFGNRLSQFGGTSAATPMVTAALSNVMSILPDYPQQSPERTNFFKQLLRNTAIRTSGFNPDGGLNGPGSLNSYKMLRVAARLRAAGYPGTTTPYGPAQIADPASPLYDFRSDTRQLLEQAQALLRDHPGECASLRQATRLMREAYFLTPSDLSSRANLAALYREHGYASQADFVAGEPAGSAVARMQPVTARAFAELRRQMALPKDQRGLSPEALNDIMSVPDIADRRKLIEKALDGLGNSALPLVRRLLSDTGTYTLPGKGGVGRTFTMRDLVIDFAEGQAREGNLARAKKLYAFVLKAPESSAATRALALQMIADRVSSTPNAFFSAAEVFAIGRQNPDGQQQPAAVRRRMTNLIPQFTFTRAQCVDFATQMRQDPDPQVRAEADAALARCPSS